MVERSRQPKATGALSRTTLEDLLKQSYKEGVVKIPRQVRYVLALSRFTAPRTTTYHDPLANIAQARLTALTQLADVLEDRQIKFVLDEIDDVETDSARLPMLVDLAMRLDSQDFPIIMRDMWKQAVNIKDEVVRSRALIGLAPLLSLSEDEPATASDLLDVVAIAQSIGNTEARVRSLVAIAPHLPRTVSTRLLKRALDDINRTKNNALRSSTICAMASYIPTEIEENALDSALAITSPSERARALTALARCLSDAHQERLRAAALDAISNIPNEDERATAFIDFVPYLEYASERSKFPEQLEHALRIAVAMPRRHIRARAMVTLAPHLTSDLQGEALAAVHGLDNEHERASLLAELAPTLPPDMLVASLAVAHTMREQDARVYALTALAHHVPQHARDQTLLDALAAAVNLSHNFERVTALMALVDVLPDPMREKAFNVALETLPQIDNENARSRALSQFAQHVPESYLQSTLDAAYALEDIQQRINALIPLLPRLEASQRDRALQYILDGITQMPFAYKQMRAIISIAPHLTPATWDRAIALTDTLEDPYDHTSACIALARHVPDDTRAPLIEQAWQLIRDIDDGYDKASALAAITPLLDESAKRKLPELAVSVIGSIMDEYDQASAITILAPLLVKHAEREAQPTLPTYYQSVRQAILSTMQIPHQQWRVRVLSESVSLWKELDNDDAYRLWTEVSWQMTALPLADTLLCLSTLLPVLRQIGGDECLKDIAQILGVR